MKHISEIIEDILVEWAYRVHDGKPNPKNPLHIVELRESMMKLNIPNDIIYKVIGNMITEEQKFYARSPKNKRISVFKNKENWKNALSSGYEKVDSEEAEKELAQQGDEPETSGSEEEPKPESPPKVDGGQDNPYDKKVDDDGEESISNSLNNGNLDGIIQFQSDLQEKRDKGLAGAGGPVASQGESLYVKHINSDFNVGEYAEKNRDQIDIYKEKIRKKGLSSSEKRTIEALGLDEERGLEYLAIREHHAQEELRRIKEDPDSVFWKKGKMGFNGKDENYLDWCYASFDGAIETQQILENDSDLDTSQPHHAVQSEKEVDDEIEKHLEEMIEIVETDEDKEYYKK